ncbi:ESX secretion-associated protein EspG [Mycolicibacterium palauense]|uniref:ESX secretion-associated protein EspG n=1 Tax=Mycolicibacterium palauense TaxID=2034511 RepID=UPI000BFF180B|nr:ESX secretion-associated protein EspG [Mycolicibacterium palauense]
MLTTSVDGLWVLQVLSGIETVAPELGLRPHFPRVEDARMALAHPVARELEAAGVITESGEVDQIVLEWLTVLARRDVALLIDARTPESGDAPARELIARFAQWWVSLERTGDLVRLGGIGTATAEGTANMLISSEIDRLCGSLKAASLRPVTLSVDELLEGVRDQDSLRRFLLNQRIDSDQLHLLTLAADPGRSAQASVVAIQAGVDGRPARSHIEQSVVTIIDTPEGRLVAEHTTSGGRRWMILSPGSPGNIASAVQKMVRRLPSENEWFSYRKVV